MGIGPYKDYAKIKAETLKTPPEAIECIKDILNYIYDRYGRFPSHFYTLMIPVAVRARCRRSVLPEIREYSLDQTYKKPHERVA